MGVRKMNWGMYQQAAEFCPHHESGLFDQLTYDIWGCTSCNHLRTDKAPPLRGQHISIWCDKGYILLAFVAPDKEQNDERISWFDRLRIRRTMRKAAKGPWVLYTPGQGRG